MLNTCPSCQKPIELEVQQIVNEEIIECPFCSHHYKVYLKPESKQIMEKGNQQVMEYMLHYPHEDQEITTDMPSGVMNTFQ